MYLTRAQTTRRLPIQRKGTKYVARALSHVKEGVPVVIAVRDMLGLAKSSKEVKHMVKDKLIKINGKEVKDIKESIRLFGILEVGNNYKLSILPTGRFVLEETKDNTRVCKVINKKILKKNNVQLNFHDGTNIISKYKVNIGDSIELDFSSKIKNVIPFEKGKNVFIMSGKNIGLVGKVKETKNDKAVIKFKDNDKEAELDRSHVIVLR